jgi:hypothetical protein
MYDYLHPHVQTGSGTHMVSYHMGTMHNPAEVKRPEHKADHSPSQIPRLKMREIALILQLDIINLNSWQNVVKQNKKQTACDGPEMPERCSSSGSSLLDFE